MKGKLYRKTEGWMVFYVEKNSAYTSTSYQKSLPLHPDNSTVILYEKHPLDWDGKEVDFEIVNESWDGYRGCVYAKLTNQVPDVRKMVEDDVEKLANEEYPTGRFENLESYDDRNRLRQQGFIKGWNKCKETLYTEEQVNQKMIDFANWCRMNDNKELIIEQLFSTYKSLKQPKKD